MPSVVKAPDRQGQKGLTLVRSADELPAAIGRAIEESRSGVAIIEELVDGPEVTVNAFSLRGDFHPLTVTDRLTAEPPAFGVALARTSGRARRAWTERPRGRGRGARARDRERPQLHAAPDRAGRSAGDRGRSAPRRRPRRGALRSSRSASTSTALALQAALGEPIWSAALQPTPEVGGAVVRFLVPPEGVLEEVEGADEARCARRRPGRTHLPRARPCLRPVPARRRSRGRGARDRGQPPRRRWSGPTRPLVSYASRSVQKVSSDRRSTMLGFQPPAIGDEEIAAVAETLRSGWLTTGPRAAELERRFAEYVEAEHVLAVASGTAALHLALLARRRRARRRGDHDARSPGPRPRT